MQTFKTDHDAVFWAADDGEWVPAYVAQGVYEQLRKAEETLCYVLKAEGHYVDQYDLDDMRAALAAADGEEV